MNAAKAHPVDLIRPILSDEVVRAATIVDGIESIVRDCKNKIAAANMELLGARIDLRESIVALNRHDAARRA